MRRAVHAEWTKARTVTGTGWLALGALSLTVALGAVVSLATHEGQTGSGEDLTRLSLTGVYLGQAVVAVLAVLSITGEYSSGMITVTLGAVPRRPMMLAAKATVLSALVAVVGTVAVLGSLWAGRLILAANGFTAAHGYALVTLGHGATLRAAAGSVLYLALIALLSLGVATAVRDGAIAIGLVLGLLYLFPIFAHLVGSPALGRHLEQIGPMTAGLAIQATTNLRSLPIAPWPGLGVLAAWTAVALLAGGTSLALRDA
jgi:ABC-2 type transport system permease protein